MEAYGINVVMYTYRILYIVFNSEIEYFILMELIIFHRLVLVTAGCLLRDVMALLISEMSLRVNHAREGLVEADVHGHAGPSALGIQICNGWHPCVAMAGDSGSTGYADNEI